MKFSYAVAGRRPYMAFTFCGLSGRINEKPDLSGRINEKPDNGGRPAQLMPACSMSPWSAPGFASALSDCLLRRGGTPTLLGFTYDDGGGLPARQVPTCSRLRCYRSYAEAGRLQVVNFICVRYF